METNGTLICDPLQDDLSTISNEDKRRNTINRNLEVFCLYFCMICYRKINAKFATTYTALHVYLSIA